MILEVRLVSRCGSKSSVILVVMYEVMVVSVSRIRLLFSSMFILMCWYSVGERKEEIIMLVGGRVVSRLMYSGVICCCVSLRLINGIV